MDYQMSPEHCARLRDRYAQAVTRYEAAKEATDAAQAAREAACQACDAALQTWEAAYAEEVRYGQVVRQTALAYQVALDAAFLAAVGIAPSSVLPESMIRKAC